MDLHERVVRPGLVWVLVLLVLLMLLMLLMTLQLLTDGLSLLINRSTDHCWSLRPRWIVNRSMFMLGSFPIILKTFCLACNSRSMLDIVDLLQIVLNFEVCCSVSFLDCFQFCCGSFYGAV